MQENHLEIHSAKSKSNYLYPLIITILIGAWLIGLSILGAGWLISKEISRQSTNVYSEINEQSPIDIKLPEILGSQGSEDSKVVVVEFADFQCPFCGEWQKEIYSKLKTEYIDSKKIKFVFWPIAFLGEESNKAAEAALCAKDQGKFWEYHDILYLNQSGENQGAFADYKLQSLADKIGIKQEDFITCFNSRIFKPHIEDLTNSSATYGVNSTPTVFINGQKLEGVQPWENYKLLIESELNKEE